MNKDILLLYAVAFIISLGMGIWASVKLIPQKGESSPIARLIRLFSGIGIGFATFGILFLIIHAVSEPFKDNRWDQDAISVKVNVSSEEINSDDINLTHLQQFEAISDFETNIARVSESNGRVTLNKQDDFSLDTLEFNEKSSSTAMLLFTIAGITLGALGVFWLGFLETNRLPEARKHDQIVQNDNIRSLLKYALAVLVKIDKEVLNFKAGYSVGEPLYEEIKKLAISADEKLNPTKSEKTEINLSALEKFVEFLYELIKKIGILADENFDLKKSEKIEINLFALEKYRENQTIKNEFERQVHISYRFLFDRAVAKKSTLLEEIERVVLLIDQFILEKDFILYDDEKSDVNEVGVALINLVEAYKSYLNTVNGIDSETDLSKSSIKNTVIDYQKLLRNNHDKDINPLTYLNQIYGAKGELIFYETFIATHSYDFIKAYLINDSKIFEFFDCEELSDMFILMDYVHLDVRRFFLSYFEKAFIQYIEKMKFYKTVELNAKNDLAFEEYITIIDNALKTIQGEKRSLSKLFGLYKALYRLDKKIPKNDKQDTK